MSNHPGTCLLDDREGWVVCSCHGHRWRVGAFGIAPCGCFYADCDEAGPIWRRERTEPRKPWNWHHGYDDTLIDAPDGPDESECY